MKPTSLFWMLLLLVPIPLNAQLDDISSRHSSHAELVLFVNPENLLEQGLSRAWRNLDRCFEGRRIQGRPFSKVHFNLSPVPSADGAIVNLHLTGSSVGETRNTKNGTEVYSDSLTQFKSWQQVFVTANQIHVSEPQLKIQTAQSFNRAKSKNPLKPILVKRIYSSFPREIEKKSREFSEEEIRRQLKQTVNETLATARSMLLNGAEQFPWMYFQYWHLSSTQQNVVIALDGRVASGFQRYDPSRAINLIANEEFFEGLGHRGLSNRSFNGNEVRRFFNRLSNNAAPSPSQPASWSVRFDSNPIEVTLSNGIIGVKLFLKEFESKGRSLEEFSASVNYQFSPGKKPQLNKVGSVKLSGECFSGRNQVLKSIVRQRIESQLPETIKIESLFSTKTNRKLDVELKLSDVILEDQYITIQIDHE